MSVGLIRFGPPQLFYTYPYNHAVDKYPRTTYEYGNHVHMCKYSYSTVDVIKQRNMVNSGVRGAKGMDLA